jgi:CRISPR-associated protein Cmr4
MFEASSTLFLYVETSLHAGTGKGLAGVDLPIQRERTTGYPMVQASSIKGTLRAAATEKKMPEVEAVFGPDQKSGAASDHAGALSCGDARILLFPVRSLAGVFAWVTSAGVLHRFVRDLAPDNPIARFKIPPAPEGDQALVGADCKLKAGDSVVLEEFSFAPVASQSAAVDDIAKWLGENALPEGGEYEYWRKSLPERLCILPEEAFRDFCLYGTEVQTHVKLVPETKTVKDGALWTSESLPPDALLYVPLFAAASRQKDAAMKATEVLAAIKGLDLPRLQLGGDETTGQGIVALRFLGGAK